MPSAPPPDKYPTPPEHSEQSTAGKINPAFDPAVDDQVEHPDQGSGAAPTLDSIRTAVKVQLDDAERDLDKLRADRDALNLRIRDAVQARDEVAKIYNQLQPKAPRTRKPKAAAETAT